MKRRELLVRKICSDLGIPRPRSIGLMRTPPRELSVMPRMQPMANSALEQAGWVLVATCGTRRQFKHPLRPGRVTVAGRPSDDLAPGT